MSRSQDSSITAGASPASGVELLLEAGAVLATSLDPRTTMGQVARLTVPRLGDLCTIDLVHEDGSIRDAAVAAADEGLARALEELRARHPLDPSGEHPVARVIRSSEPELLAEMGEGLLRSFAQGSEHARFMIAHRYRSAAVAPLSARGRTLGALSVLRLGDSPPLTDEDMALVGELARRAGLAIDNARLFSDLRGVEQRLEAVLASLAEAVTVMDEHGRIVFANQAAADLLGASTPAELTSARPGTIMERFLVLDERGRELGLEAMPSRRVFEGIQPEPLLVRNIVRATGEERWLVARSSPVADPETGRVRYAVSVFENITDVKRVEIAERFMSEASRVLASSMSYKETLRHVAELAVPLIADWCAIDLLGPDGLERVAIHHSQPERLALVERLTSLYRPVLHEPSVVPAVLRSGRAQILTDIPSEALASLARDREHLRLLEAFKATAMIIVPMIGATGPVGAITLVSSESLRRLTATDLSLAERLGRRAGTAVENARLYTERTRIAQTLQRALRPQSLPEIPGIEISARYSPAGELNEAGGDFYDAFEPPGGEWTLVIGDVCGKGAGAAGVTALARHTLKAAAMSGRPPLDMLRILHQELRRQPPGEDLCTVCLVTLARVPEGLRLGIALAGHQQPLLISATGEAERVGEPGTLLGVRDPIEISESTATMGPGETLLLYTDGVLEGGQPRGRSGERRLLELCREAPELELSRFLQRIEQEALDSAGGMLSDDVALLAIRPSARAR